MERGHLARIGARDILPALERGHLARIGARDILPALERGHLARTLRGERMLTESFQSIVAATRQVVRNWRAMIVLAVLYASLLGSLYLFVTVKEASTGQVASSLALAVLAPLLFFALLTVSVNQSRAGSANNAGSGRLLKDFLSSSWKVVVISLPLIALGILAVYLLGRSQTSFGAGASLPNLADPYPTWPQNAGSSPPLRWSVVTVTAIRYIFIGMVLPMIAIHLWIAISKEGFVPAVKRMKGLIARAFAPNSVLIYMIGFLVFAIVPYVLLFWATPASRPWLEIALFVGRLCVVFALTLFGWVVTMNALAISANQSSHESATESR